MIAFYTIRLVKGEEMVLSITRVAFIFLTITAAFILTTCQYSNKNISSADRLAYTVDNEKFVLNKECLDYLGLRTDSKFTLFIKIKNKSKCSGRFNFLVKKNIGKNLITSFNNSELDILTIKTPIEVQEGYFQRFTNKNMVLEIMKAYNVIEDETVFNEIQP